MDSEEEYLNIGDSCRIGSQDKHIKNKDFPNSLFDSITVIGKDSRVLDTANIGGACYIASGLGEDFFAGKKYLYDGQSIIE